MQKNTPLECLHSKGVFFRYRKFMIDNRENSVYIQYIQL